VHFPAGLKVVSTTVLHDPRRKAYESKKVEVPGVALNGLRSHQVSALLLGSQKPTGFPINFLGNGLLRHYDLIIDFLHDRMYLKPVTG